MAKQHEPIVLIIGTDDWRSTQLAYAITHAGYAVVMTESPWEVFTAITTTLPAVILLDNSAKADALGLTVERIARYLGSDGPAYAPPLLVVTDSEIQPHWPGVFHVLTPTSEDVIIALVREYIQA